MPQCQANKAFVSLECKAVLSWGCVQGFLGTPGDNDHCLAQLGLRQDKVQAVTAHGSQSCGKSRWEQSALHLGFLVFLPTL